MSIKVRVLSVNQEAEDIKSFLLRSSDGRPLPPFTAGAHVDVTPPGGPTRQYSLCGSLQPGAEYQIAVKLESASRGGSAAMHRLADGDELVISEPRNHFPLAEAARRHILIAGGIGITPILAMARHLNHDDTPYELHYFARSRRHAAFVDVLSQADFSASPKVFYFGVEPQDVKERVARIFVGVDREAHVYFCGPTLFMESVKHEATQALPITNIHFEYFSNAVAANSNENEESFEVELFRSGRTVMVSPDVRLIDVLWQAGVEVEASCEQGICGTCVTRVLDGVPDHRDLFLLDAEKQENKKMCVCISRSKSRKLVLDI